MKRLQGKAHVMGYAADSFPTWAGRAGQVSNKNSLTCFVWGVSFQTKLAQALDLQPGS